MLCPKFLLYLIPFFSLVSCYLPSLKKSAPKLLHSSVGAKSSNDINNLILFDGVCNFCNAWVDTLVKLDTKKKFSFAALHSEKGREPLRMLGREPNDISSVVFVKNAQKAFFKSDVPIEVLKELQGGFFAAGLLMSLFPLFFRNSVYDVVATNRYNILGKRSDCRCGETIRGD